MVGYTKLSCDIIHSSVWQTPLHVKVMWITMLAMSDKDGEVHASIPGIAKVADVTLEQCEDALTRFSSPDPYSRTKDFDGRRIEPTEDGWRLLNHEKYRNLMSANDIRSKAAERQRRFRERNKRYVTPRVTESDACNDIQIQIQSTSTPTVCAQLPLLTEEAMPTPPTRAKKALKPKAGPSIASVLDVGDDGKLANNYWVTAKFWDQTKNPRPREAAEVYRSIHDRGADMVKVAMGAKAYYDAHMPPKRAKDESHFMIGFKQWLEAEGWESALRENC